MSPRRRKDPADAWMPPRVYRGKSAYEYHPPDGGAIRLCRLTATPAEVLRAHELVVATTPAEYTLAWLVKQYEASPQYARLARPRRSTTRRQRSARWP